MWIVHCTVRRTARLRFPPTGTAGWRETHDVGGLESLWQRPQQPARRPSLGVPRAVLCGPYYKTRDRKTPDVMIRSDKFVGGLPAWSAARNYRQTIVVIIYLPNNTTVCTFASIQFPKSRTARSDKNTNSCPKRRLCV